MKELFCRTFGSYWLVVFCFQFFYSPLAFSKPSLECIQWFVESSTKPENKNCELECTALITDTSTFICPQECSELCKSKRGKSFLSKLLFYPGLTPAEKALVKMYPRKALIVFKQKITAERSSSRNFPEQSIQDESDAFRHFIWAGLLTKELGKEDAKLFLDAHEENRLQTNSEKSMDLHNNSVGQKAAERLIRSNNWSLKNLEQKGLDALKSNKLNVLKPGLKIPENPQ